MKLSNLVSLAIALAFLLAGILSIASAPGVSYHLLKKVPFAPAEGAAKITHPVWGDEYYDYISIDPDMRRVYLTHGKDVKVVDADSFAEVGTLTGFKLNHGVALVQELGKGFISDGQADEAVIFDLKTLKVTGRVTTGSSPDSIIYDPASKRVFAFNSHSKDATAIDPKTETVVGTVPLGGVPEAAAFDGNGTVYNNMKNTNEVVAFDSKALKTKARWPVAPAGIPCALAMDRQHRRLFIGGRDPQVLVVMNADNGQVIQSFPISKDNDAIVFEPETGLIFVSTREGYIHIFHEDSPDKFSVVDKIETEYGTRTMALDPKTHNLYTVTSDYLVPHTAPPVNIPGTFRLLVYGR